MNQNMWSIYYAIDDETPIAYWSLLEIMEARALDAIVVRPNQTIQDKRIEQQLLRTKNEDHSR